MDITPEGALPLMFEHEVGSTNDVATDEARAGAPHGWAICAERQVSGRGRRGHSWSSPAGSLSLSVVVRPDVPMSQLIAVPALAGMGVMDALASLGLAGRVGIKWPNDIVARTSDEGGFDRKLVGILVEGRSGDAGPFAVVGIGINREPVQMDASELAQGRAAGGPRALPPVSLAELLGEDAPELPRLAALVRDAVVARVDAWAAALAARPAAGPLAPILSEYFDMVPLMGHEVAVLTPEGRVVDTGAFSGLDVWGRACVRTPRGEKSYPAEAVSLRALDQL